jgi:hypothetical protein
VTTCRFGANGFRVGTGGSLEGGMVGWAVSLCWSTLIAVLDAPTATPTTLLTAATAAVAGMLLALVVAHLVAVHAEEATSSVRARAVGLLQRARRSAFLRLRDPNAAGRPRPRAPSRRPRAT